MFARTSSNIRLISRIYKEFKKLNTKRANNSINKWQMNSAGFSEEVQMSNEHISKRSIFLSIKEMQIKVH
jgi:hypothetical protein